MFALLPYGRRWKQKMLNTDILHPNVTINNFSLIAIFFINISQPEHSRLRTGCAVETVAVTCGVV